MNEPALVDDSLALGRLGGVICGESAVIKTDHGVCTVPEHTNKNQRPNTEVNGQTHLVIDLTSFQSMPPAVVAMLASKRVPALTRIH
jgi:hypothetical protein